MNCQNFDQMRQQILDHYEVKAVSIPRSILCQQFNNLRYVFSGGPVYVFIMPQKYQIINSESLFDLYTDSYDVATRKSYQIYVHRDNYTPFNSIEQFIDYCTVEQIVNE